MRGVAGGLGRFAGWLAGAFVLHGLIDLLVISTNLLQVSNRSLSSEDNFTPTHLPSLTLVPSRPWDVHFRACPRLKRRSFRAFIKRGKGCERLRSAFAGRRTPCRSTSSRRIPRPQSAVVP